MADAANPPRRIIPSPEAQATYFATGALAAAAALPIEVAFAARASSQTPLQIARATASTLAARCGVRFWAFAGAKHNLADTTLPTWLKGGLAGGAGGVVEVLAHQAALRQAPSARAVAAQGARTFLGFSTFTFLWSRERVDGTIDARRPPRPFARCLADAVAAGSVASVVVGLVEGARGRDFWLGGAPRGALVVGVTIAVQVTAAGWILERFGLE